MISLGAPGSAIDIDVGLASVFHPPATYGYAGSIAAETDFVALPVAVQHMALALPVALGHARTFLIHDEALVERSIGENCSRSRVRNG